MTAPHDPQCSQGPWPGRFVWHDCMTTDAEKSATFYQSLFGWDFNVSDMQGGTYRMILCGPGPIGGIIEEKNIPVSHWMPYLAVDDVDATAAKIRSLGGGVCVPPTDIPNTGRFAVVNDPQGAYFSIYKGLPEAQGFDPDLTVPGRICWNELCTDDEAGAQKFYSEVFGWQPMTSGMGDGKQYHVQMLGDKGAGGMMKVPMPGMPSCWCVYFFVEDLAAMTDKAKELGATTMMEVVPIPQFGSFSVLTDPAGAVFMLYEPVRAQGCGDCGCHG
jgi:predicted enzyme related to lactoylglutathione lyase